MGLFDIFKNNEEKVVNGNVAEDSGNTIVEDIPVVAKDTLTEILDLMGFFNVVKITDQEKDFVALEIKGDDLGRIIGKDGNTLQALQMLLKNILCRKFKKPVSVQLDANNYKEKRVSTIKSMALDSADKAISENKQIELVQMSAWERRIVHMTLQDNDKVKTESIGEAKDRRVIIYPNK